MDEQRAWDDASAWMGTLADLDAASAVLEGDRETIMPPGAAEGRGSQLATLAALRHRHLLDPAVGDALARITESDDPWRAASGRLAMRERTRAARVPEDLVRALTEASSRGVATWAEARPAVDVGAWVDAVAPLMALTRQQAEALADGGDPYDEIGRAHV